MLHRPSVCNSLIYWFGKCVALLHTTSSAETENWVRQVAQEANAWVDWHYAAGHVVVLHLGLPASLQRVRTAIDKYERSLGGGYVISKY